MFSLNFLMLTLSIILLTIYLLPTNVDCKHIETFEDFKKIFNKKYLNDEIESARKHHFYKALTKLEQIRKHHPTVELGLNEYSDLSDEEYQQMFPEPRVKNVQNLFSHHDHHHTEPTNAPLPTNFDWRDKIEFSPVQTQGIHCGACWSFSATAAVEAIYAIKNRTKNLQLSKQEIVDCSEHSVDSDYRNHGCYYGYDTDAYAYIKKQGVMEERYYPYTGTFNETCMRETIHAPIRFRISGWHSMSYNISDHEIMQLLIERGPLTLDILASHEVFRNYKGGIIRYTYPYSRNTNHAVLLIGYGHYEPLKIDYWIIRNSWGTTWGEGGYARVERGYDQMGLNNFISYPILN